MRLLITGVSGELGGPLLRTARQRTGIEAFGTTFTQVVAGAEQIDLTDAAAVEALIRRAQPDTIIHTALSERSPRFEMAIPQAGAVLAETANAKGIRLVALSTDMVFDGTEAPYSTTDPPTSQTPYGKAKREMEARIQAIYENATIVRTSLIYDFAVDNRQIGWMVERIKAGEAITLFVDEIRQPIWVWDLARTLIELCEKDWPGLVHVAGPAAVSRYDYGMQLLAAMDLAERATVKAVEAAKVAPQRPRDLTLRLTEGLVTPIRSVGAAATRAELGPRDLDDNEAMV